MKSEKKNEKIISSYWRINIIFSIFLLTIWFLTSCVFSTLLIEKLNKFYIFNGGTKLGFWLAQQGTIFVFVGLIVVYVIFMHFLDRFLLEKMK